MKEQGNERSAGEETGGKGASATLDRLPPAVSPRGFPDEVVLTPELDAELHEREPPQQGEWPPIVRSLRNENFRLFWGGNFLSNTGTWMQNVAQGWLVLQLTNSSFWLGFIGFAASAPFLLFTLFGGVIADRVNKRYLLLATQTAMMLLAFAMAALAYLKIITVGQIAVLAFLNGVAMALNAPSYQALVPQLVHSSDLPNAIALNSAQFNLSRVLGPTLGGYAMAWLGVAGNFFLNGLSFLAVVAALFRIRYPREDRARDESVWSSLGQGFAYVRSQREMAALIALVASASLLLFPFITFIPYFAKNVLHKSASGLGLLMAGSGLGAFVAAAVLAYVGRIRRRGAVVVFSGLLAMAGVMVLCYSHSFVLSWAMMFVEGFGLTMTASTMNVALQQLTSNEMRGRVMSIYATSFLGLPPLGSLVEGELSRHMATEHAIAATTLLAMVSFVAFYVRSAPLRNLD